MASVGPAAARDACRDLPVCLGSANPSDGDRRCSGDAFDDLDQLVDAVPTVWYTIHDADTVQGLFYIDLAPFLPDEPLMTVPG